MMTIGSVMASLWLATAAVPAAKVPAALGQEMADAIVAVNKALGLESWPAHGAQPCVDRGGEGSLTKDVSADDTRRCAGEALSKGFPELGKGYALAILMTPGGPPIHFPDIHNIDPSMTGRPSRREFDGRPCR